MSLRAEAPEAAQDRADAARSPAAGMPEGCPAPGNAGHPSLNDSRGSALFLAARGFPVFRIRTDTLTPGREGWPESASADPEVVRKDFTDAVGDSVADNIAVLTGRRIVAVDVDTKRVGVDAYASLDQLDADGLPGETFTVSTPSGGLHRYYLVDEDSEYASLNDWRPGIDFKGWHGYVRGPGSIKPDGLNEDGTVKPGGEYTIVNNCDPVPLPEKFAAQRRRAKRSFTEVNAEAPTEWEDDSSIERAIAYLKIAELGAGRGNMHAPVLRLGHNCFDMGITPATTCQLIREYWPPFADYAEDLEGQISSLARGRLKDPKRPWGSDHIRRRPSVHLTFERIALDPRHSGGVSNDNAGLAPIPVIAPSRKRIPRRKWLVEGFVAREMVTALIAPGGSGKTQWTASFALAIATGRQDILDLPIKEKAKVWLWNQEDEADELARRVGAVLQHFGIADEDLLDEDGAPRLFMNSGVDRRFMLTSCGQNGALRQHRQIITLIMTVLASSYSSIRHGRCRGRYSKRPFPRRRL